MGNEAEIWQRALLESLEEILDRMAMLDVLPGEQGESKVGAHALKASLPLDGTDSYRLELLVHEGLAGEVAAAILGMDVDELEPTDLEDAVCELSNMVGGATKTRMGEEAVEFSLRIPELERNVDAGARGLGDDGLLRLQVQVGEYPMEISVSRA